LSARPFSREFSDTQGHMMQWGGDWSLISILSVIAGIGLLVIGIFIITKLFSKQETPLEILKKRYALGEISLEEFEQIKQEIDKS